MKAKKNLLIILLIVIALFCMLTACNNTITKEGSAYGLVHNSNYIGMAKISTDNTGKIIAVQLDEVCLPNYLKADTTVREEDVVVVGNNRYFKTVKYNKVEMNFDMEKDTYYIGEVSMQDYFKDVEKAKEFYLAVEKNMVTVMLNDKEDKSVMTAKHLMKSQNNYWKAGVSGKGWLANRDATVAYVLAHGFPNGEFSKSTNGTWQDVNGIDTGATWVDMSGEKEGFYSYMTLLKMANDAI